MKRLIIRIYGGGEISSRVVLKKQTVVAEERIDGNTLSWWHARPNHVKAIAHEPCYITKITVDFGWEIEGDLPVKGLPLWLEKTETMTALLAEKVCTLEGVPYVSRRISRNLRGLQKTHTGEGSHTQEV